MLTAGTKENVNAVEMPSHPCFKSIVTTLKTSFHSIEYSKKFLEAHREEIALHKAAKAAFDEAGLQKLPKVKALDAEFAELLTKKKAAYPEYRKARNEMQELVRAQKNVERFFAEEKPAQENEQAR
jgi:3-oxoacyl-(acyl-carrier-protein) synthase